METEKAAQEENIIGKKKEEKKSQTGREGNVWSNGGTEGKWRERGTK